MSIAEPNTLVKGYWSTRQLCERYDCSRSSLHRWMKRGTNPFPQPRLKANGSNNRWAIDDVEAWENQEAGRNAA